MDKKTAIELIRTKMGPWVSGLDDIVAPLFSSEWGKRSSLAALILSSCILFYMVVCVFTDWYHNVTVLRVSESKNVAVESNVAALVAQIPSWHLFGEYGVVEKSARLPITSLQIELTGIIKAQPDSFSRVIISEGGKPGKVYQVGDTLESGVKIYGIMEDNVVLENGGQLEKLPLRRMQLHFQKKFQPLLSRTPEMRHRKTEITPGAMRHAPASDETNDEEP